MTCASWYDWVVFDVSSFSICLSDLLLMFFTICVSYFASLYIFSQCRFHRNHVVRNCWCTKCQCNIVNEQRSGCLPAGHHSTTRYHWGYWIDWCLFVNIWLIYIAHIKLDRGCIFYWPFVTFLFLLYISGFSATIVDSGSEASKELHQQEAEKVWKWYIW